jgi:hypothetical protein
MKLNYANMRFRPPGTIIRLNIERPTSNAEYGTLCIIDFKKGDHPDDVIRKTKSSYLERTSCIACGSGFQPRSFNFAAGSRSHRVFFIVTWTFRISAKRKISKGKFALLGFYKLTEFIIRCWTFDVRCSAVSFSIRPDVCGQMRRLYKWDPVLIVVRKLFHPMG